MDILNVFVIAILIGFGQAAFPWFSSMDNEHQRFTRDVATKKGNNCTFSCLQEMDDTFNKSYGVGNHSYWDDEKYDEKRFDKLCKAYEPTSKCLNQCPKENFKIMVVGSFSVLEYMCISHTKEAKKQFPCLDKIHNETKKACDPKCQPYEQALKKWQTLRMTPELLHDKFNELVQIFSESCNYGKCEKDCSSPLITKQCGNDGKSFMDGFWLNMLQSLNNTTMIANSILANSGLRGKSFSLCQN